MSKARIINIGEFSPIIPSFLYSSLPIPYTGKELKDMAMVHTVKKEWPRVLVNFSRWDLERKNQLDAPPGC